MKYAAILIFLILLSCSTGEPAKYPEGFEEVDMASDNDCALSECSLDRIIRLTASDVDGRIYFSSQEQRFFIWRTKTFDTVMFLYFCDLPEAFQEEGLEVRFSGDLYDACGIHEVSGPVTSYIVHLSHMELK